MTLIATYMLGRLRDGAERDKGHLLHAVTEIGRALCGATPGPRSVGWADHPDRIKDVSETTCVRCRRALLVWDCGAFGKVEP